MYTIDDNNLHIFNSYKVDKENMDITLDILRLRHPESNVWKRSMFSLRMEWVCHNFLYAIAYAAKDVDLEYPCKIEWLYKVLGVLVWVFVK